MYNYDTVYKIVVTGDMGVGKTSLVIRAQNGRFDYNYNTTIGVDFAMWNVKVRNDRNEDRLVKLTVFDTAGQECFHSITKSYYSRAVAAFIVFDISDRTTFESIKMKWKDDVLRNSSIRSSHILLIGNKSDLMKREVTYDEGNKYAITEGLAGYLETSARNGDNVSLMFDMLAQNLYNTYNIPFRENFVDLYSDSRSRSICCRF